jgi:hypothetical protein
VIETAGYSRLIVQLRIALQTTELERVNPQVGEFHGWWVKSLLGAVDKP